MPQKKSINRDTNFIDTVPLIRLPRSARQIFTYKNPFDRKLNKGQIVIVPFKGRFVRAVVYATHKTVRNIPYLKQIQRIITPEPYFTQQQLLLARIFSNYYITPLTLALKTFLPQKITLKTPWNIINITKPNRTKKILLKKGVYYFIQSNTQKAINKLSNIIITYLQEEQPVLFLTPTIRQLEYIYKHLSQYIAPKSIVTIHSQLKSTEYNMAIKRIKTEKSLLILALRHGVFLPFNKLGCIIMEDSNHISYKQWDQHPKYETKTIVKKLQAIYKTNIIFLTPWPNVSDWHYIKSGEGKLFNRQDWSKLKLIDIFDIKREKNPLCENIIPLLKNGRWLFLINRMGEYRLIFCQDCEWRATCPECNRHLICEKENELFCYHCKWKGTLQPFCPGCNGIYLKKAGTGIKKVAQFIESLNIKHKPIVYSKETHNINLDSLPEDSIVVATDIIFSHSSLPIFDKIVIVNADLEKNFPSWKNQDSFLQKIWQILVRIKPNGSLYIQSLRPALLKPLLQPAYWDQFIEQELEMRKKYKYPPFYELIMLSARSKKIEPTSDITAPVIKILNTFKKISYSVYTDPIKTNRGWEYRILIRVPLSEISIKEILYNKLPDIWFADIDPLTI